MKNINVIDFGSLFNNRSPVINCLYLSMISVFFFNSFSNCAIDPFYAIASGNNAGIRLWAKSKPDLTVRNFQGQSLLHAAVVTGNKKIVENVLRLHVDVNMLDFCGRTALDYAVEFDNHSMVLSLVKHQAKVTCLFDAETGYEHYTKSSKKVLVEGSHSRLDC